MLAHAVVPFVVQQFCLYLVNERHFSPCTARAYTADLIQFFLDRAEKTGIKLEDEEQAAFEAWSSSQGRSPLRPSLTTVVCECDEEDLKAYINKLKEQRYKSATVMRKVATLRSFYKWMYKKGLIESNPTASLPYLKAERIPLRRISKEELKLLLEAPSKDSLLGARDRVMLAIMCDTGARTGEMVALNNENVGEETISVGIRETRRRKLRLSERTRAEIRNYQNLRGSDVLLSGPFLINKHGGRISQRSLRRKLEKYTMKLGITLRLMDLRHTRALTDLANGKNSREVCEALGNRSQTELVRYLEALRGSSSQAALTA